MGLFDGLFGDAVGEFAGDFVERFAGDFLGGLSAPQQVAGFLPTPGFSLPSAPQAVPVMAAAPPLAARAVAAGLPAWSARFPALWQALQRIRASARVHVSVEQLRSLLRRYGPSFLAGMLGEAAVRELVTMDMTRKRRRINPANARALRRAVRRVESFDRLSARVRHSLGTVCRKKRRC